MSHLGRPEGKVVDELRLNPIAERLSELLNRPVKKLDDCVGKEVEKEVESIQTGEIILLENIQFNAGENKNDSDFAKTLASFLSLLSSPLCPAFLFVFCKLSPGACSERRHNPANAS